MTEVPTNYEIVLGPFDSLQEAQEAESPIFARSEHEYGIEIRDSEGEVVPWES